MVNFRVWGATRDVSESPAAADPEDAEPAAVEDAELAPFVEPVGPGATVLVIGAGRMGQLIVGQLALRGSAKIVLYDRSDFTRERALAAVRASLVELQSDDLVTPAMIENAIERIEMSESLDAAVLVDLVLEAVPEDLALKREIFQSIDNVLTKEHIATGTGPLLCSNSISLAPADIFQNLRHKRCAPSRRRGARRRAARASARGARSPCARAPSSQCAPRAVPHRHARRCSWCNMRFLSPVYFIDQVELIADEANAQLARGLLASLGFSSTPKMVGNKILSTRRVAKYYARQHEYVLALAKGKDGKRQPPGALKASIAFRKDPKDLPDCSICLSRPSGALILPCGHTSTCHDCAIHLLVLRQRGEHRCPICRCHIEKVLQADCPVQAEVAADGSSSAAWSFFGRSV